LLVTEIAKSRGNPGALRALDKETGAGRSLSRTERKETDEMPITSIQGIMQDESRIYLGYTKVDPTLLDFD
jgi:hypothetical protein